MTYILTAHGGVEFAKHFTEHFTEHLTEDWGHRQEVVWSKLLWQWMMGYSSVRCVTCTHRHLTTASMASSQVHGWRRAPRHIQAPDRVDFNFFHRLSPREDSQSVSQCHVTFCLWRIEPFPFQHTITFPYYLVTSCRLTLLDERYNKTPATTSPSGHKTAAVTFSFRNHTLLTPYLISRDHIVSSHIPPPHSSSTLTSVSSFVVPHLSNKSFCRSSLLIVSRVLTLVIKANPGAAFRHDAGIQFFLK